MYNSANLQAITAPAFVRRAPLEKLAKSFPTILCRNHDIQGPEHLSQEHILYLATIAQLVAKVVTYKVSIIVAGIY